jgi:hypothetical protein
MRKESDSQFHVIHGDTLGIASWFVGHKCKITISVYLTAQITVHIPRLYKLYECERGPNNINRQAAGYETNYVRGSLT